MTRSEIKQATHKAHELSRQGVTKNEIFAQISPEFKKPLLAARIVVAIPNPEGVRRYKRMNIFLAALFFVLAACIGVAKFGQIEAALQSMAPAIIGGLIFFAIFAGVAWGILKRSYGAYAGSLILLILMLLQAPRNALGPADDPAAALLDLVIGLFVPILLIWITLRVRNNIFSKAGFFGAPKKAKSGGYEFMSAFELKASGAAE